MLYRIKEAYFDEETRKSVVEIAASGGRIFRGVAFAHPNEKAGEFMGCGIACRRALIKLTKADLRLKKDELKSAENMLKTIAQMREFDPKSPTAKTVYRLINRLKRQVKELKDCLEYQRKELIQVYDRLDAYDAKQKNNKAK